MGLSPILHALPMLRLVLTMGGGLVATMGAGWVLWLLGYAPWPAADDVAMARINGLSMLGASCMAIVGVVMIALAWGRVDKLSLTVGAATAELDLEGEFDPPGEPLPEELA